MIEWIIFDWGGTVMWEFPQYNGPMVDWPEVRGMPNIESVLQTLHTRYKLALATNAAASGADQVRAALHRLNLDHYFDVIISAKELGHNKPEPAFFHAVLAECGCTPDSAVMVGDSISRDVLGAQRVGMRAVWYHWNDDPLPSYITPDAEIHDLAELPDAIAELDR
jgi:HAD superfamily hydrolase (TIGR01662 family)